MQGLVQRMVRGITEGAAGGRAAGVRGGVLLVALAAWLSLAVSAHAADLTGDWHGVNEGAPVALTLKADGRGTLDGAPLNWQLMGNLLFVEQQGEVTGYQVQLRGNTLQVAGGGLAGVLVLNRGKAPASAAGRKPAAAPSGGASGGGADIVGKWCKGGAFSAVSGGGSSSMTCIELKADGTWTHDYEGSMSAYGDGAWAGTASQSSDAGRWSLNGNTLTATSQNGQVSRYALTRRNNPKNPRDPMICLDGDCYTTAWQRAPW